MSRFVQKFNKNEKNKEIFSIPLQEEDKNKQKKDFQLRKSLTATDKNISFRKEKK